MMIGHPRAIGKVIVFRDNKHCLQSLSHQASLFVAKTKKDETKLRPQNKQRVVWESHQYLSYIGHFHLSLYWNFTFTNIYLYIGSLHLPIFIFILDLYIYQYLSSYWIFTFSYQYLSI